MSRTVGTLVLNLIADPSIPLLEKTVPDLSPWRLAQGHEPFGALKGFWTPAATSARHEYRVQLLTCYGRTLSANLRKS